MPTGNGEVLNGDIATGAVDSRTLNDSLELGDVVVDSIRHGDADSSYIEISTRNTLPVLRLATGHASESNMGVIFPYTGIESGSDWLGTYYYSPAFESVYGFSWMLLRTETEDDANAPSVSFGYTGSSTQTPRFSIGSMEVVADQIYADTTASAANVNVGASGHLQRSTSSARYKEQIEDANALLADVKLNPVRFYSPNDDRMFIGLIAEEVAEQIPEAGIVGDDDQIESYDLRSVVAALVAKVNRLEKHLEGCDC